MSRPRFKPIVYNLEKDNHFVTKVSTNTTDEKPNIVFLRAKIRITPVLDKKNYETDILDIEKKFEKYARQILDNVSGYDKDYIFSVDVAEKSVKYNKTSHLHYDIFLKPLELTILEEHRDKLKRISDILDNELIRLFTKYQLIWK